MTMATTTRIPAPDTLTDAQLRGAACVWCAGRLATATAVDLGTRPDPAWSGARWYPRGCPGCAEART
ncbi:hypothetical protein C0Q61_21990 [Streptomyces albidoflavus]|nr:hypothetical protein C0Q61_21990 [Streptomyces albidoflavus]